METAHRAVATKPTFGLTSLLLQRDVATSALAVDAYQDFFVRLQFLADRKQIFRAFRGLLVHFLDHVTFAQTSFRGRRLLIDVGNYRTLNLIWEIKRGADIIGDVRYRHSPEHCSFFRLRGFFR